MTSKLLFFSALFLIFNYMARAQNHADTIDINVTQVPLIHVLSILRQKNIPLAYSENLIPFNTPVSIHAHNISIVELLNKIGKQALINIQFIEGYYVVTHKKEYIKRPPIAPALRKTIPTPIPLKIRTYSSVHQTKRRMPYPISSYLIDRPPHQHSVRQVESIPETKHTPLILSLVVGYEANNNHFQKGLTKDQHYISKPTRSMAATLLYPLPLKNVKGSLAIKRGRTTIEYHYHYQFTDLEDPFPIPDKTIMKEEFLSLPLNIVYQIYHTNKGSLEVAAGVEWAWKQNTHELKYYHNNDPVATTEITDRCNNNWKVISIGISYMLSITQNLSLVTSVHGRRYISEAYNIILSPTAALQGNLGLAFKLSK